MNITSGPRGPATSARRWRAPSVPSRSKSAALQPRSTDGVIVAMVVLPRLPFPDSRSGGPGQLLDQAVHLGRRLHMGHMALAVEHVNGDSGGQPGGVRRRNDPVLPAPDDLRRHANVAQSGAERAGLGAAGKDAAGARPEGGADTVDARVQEDVLEEGAGEDRTST